MAPQSTNTSRDERECSPTRQRATPPASRTADIPLAVWPCAQRTSQWQRYERYTPESNRHPAKMLPEIAKRAISFYSNPGDLVLDPMCGIATTLIESIHQHRNAIGVELEPRWTALAASNIKHARNQGASGKALVLTDDARRLGRGVLNGHIGKIPLILTSPPYGNATLGDPRAGKGAAITRACEGRRTTAADRACAATHSKARRYGDSPSCLTRLPYGNAQELNPATDRDPASESYLSTMANIYTACARMLKPGGFLVLVTKNLRSQGALRNLAGDTTTLCQHAGLTYWQHIIALLATVHQNELQARPSLWQLLHTRNGEHTQLVGHEDILVFRKPHTPS
jgi:modification methylase